MPVEKNFRNFGFGLAVMLAPLTLAACSSDFGPGPMPTGYAYHGEEYKGPRGPRPVLMKKSRLQSKEFREVIAYHPHTGGPHAVLMANDPAGWQAAADSLISRLVNEFGRPVEPVRVLPGNEPGFELALEQALRNHNIPVSAAPGEGPFTIEYSTQPMGDMSIADRMMVSIEFLSVDKPAHDVSGIHTVDDDADMAVMPVQTMTPERVEGAPMPIMPMHRE